MAHACGGFANGGVVQAWAYQMRSRQSRCGPCSTIKRRFFCDAWLCRHLAYRSPSNDSEHLFILCVPPARAATAAGPTCLSTTSACTGVIKIHLDSGSLDAGSFESTNAERATEMVGAPQSLKCRDFSNGSVVRACVGHGCGVNQVTLDLLPIKHART